MPAGRGVRQDSSAVDLDTSLTVLVGATALVFLLGYLLRRTSRIAQEREAQEAARRRANLEKPPTL
jgi:hypothetical protein